MYRLGSKFGVEFLEYQKSTRQPVRVRQVDGCRWRNLGDIIEEVCAGEEVESERGEKSGGAGRLAGRVLEV